MLKGKPAPQKILAERYGRSISYISRRAGVARIKDHPIVSRIKSREIPISVLEPVVTVTNPEDLEELLTGIEDEYVMGSSTTVSQVEFDVQNVNHRRKAKNKLQHAIDSSKEKNRICPECGEPPRTTDFNGLPWVRCDKYHEWSLKTGKRSASTLRVAKNTQTSLTSSKGGTVEEKKIKKVSGTIRVKAPLKDWRPLFEEYARVLIDGMPGITSISVHGSDDMTMSYSSQPHINFSGKGHRLSFSMEEHKYVSGDQTSLKLNDWNVTKKDRADTEQFLRDLQASGEKVRTRVFPEITTILKQLKSRLKKGKRTGEEKLVTELEHMINKLPRGKRA